MGANIMVSAPMPSVDIVKMFEAGLKIGTESCDLQRIKYVLDKTTGQYVQSVDQIDIKTDQGQAMLPVEVGEKIFLAFSELNNLDDKKKD